MIIILKMRFQNKNTVFKYMYFMILKGINILSQIIYFDHRYIPIVSRQAQNLPYL